MIQIPLSFFNYFYGWPVVGICSQNEWFYFAMPDGTVSSNRDHTGRSPAPADVAAKGVFQMI